MSPTRTRKLTELRKRTGATAADAERALRENGWDADAAAAWLGGSERDIPNDGGDW